MITLVLAVIAALAVWVGSLYLRPFGRCAKCKGTGHIKRGARRRPVCPRFPHRPPGRPEDPRRAASRRQIHPGGQ